MGFSTDEELLNSINLESITQYRDYINQLRPILLGDSGFSEVTTDIPLQEGLKNALPSQQNQHRRLTASVQELQGEIARREEAGITTGMFGTTEGRELGHGIGRFSTTELKNILQRNTTELETLTGKLTKSTKLEKTAERTAMEERYKKLEEQQLALNEAQFARQQAALKGEIATSPILEKEIKDEFAKFKESQARAGNIILGDDPFTAVGKGTAAENTLAKFQDNAKAAKQREIESIINQTPLAYGGMELASGGYGSRARSTPGAPDISGLSQLSLSGQQPFQFNRQMQMQQQMMNTGTKKQKSGLLTAGGGIGGALLAGSLSGWNPNMMQVGMGAGSALGSAF
jgi:hypothetical protein